MRIAASALVVVQFVACSNAQIGLPSGSGSPNSATPTGGASNAGGAAAVGAAGLGPGMGAPFQARMQRLTAGQYRATVADIFGAAIVVPDLESDSRIAGFDELGAALVSTSARGVELYDAAAASVAKQVLADTARLPTTVGCAPASATSPDASCAGMFLDRVGRRLFRRPLDVDERARYLSIASEGATATGSFWGGLEYMLSGLLRSPLFIYRSEWSSGTAGAVAPIRGYDMAARLSFGLLDTSPDEGLLDAAARGELDTPEGVKQAATRLLSSERGQLNVDDFFSRMLRLPNGTTPEAVAMKSETLLVLHELKAQKAPFTQIYSAPFTFVNDTLAQLYGLPDRPGATLTKVMLPAGSVRRGLLGHAGVLGESGLNPSAILRGKYIREALLCQVIPPPPPNVVPVLPPQMPGKPETMRQRLTRHRVDPACAACHGLMDPPGLALENFDGTGRYRADDRGMPIDASGDLDGTPFADAAGLGVALAAHPDASKCLVATLHRRLTGQYEQAGQAPTVERLSSGYLQNDHTVDDLVLDIVGAETFSQATLAP